MGSFLLAFGETRPFGRPSKISFLGFSRGKPVPKDSSREGTNDFADLLSGCKAASWSVSVWSWYPFVGFGPLQKDTPKCL